MRFSRNAVRLGLLAFALSLTVAPFLAESAAQLATPLNNATSSLAAPHQNGSGTLVLKTGEGSRFGAPTPDAPIRVTVAARSTLVNGQVAATSTQTIFRVEGRTGDTLTGLTAIEGTTDQNFLKLDPVASLITAGTIAEVQDAVTTTKADVSGLSDSIDQVAGTVATKADDASVVKLTGDQSVSGVKTHTSDLALGTNAKLVASRPTLGTVGASCFKFDPSAAPAMQIGGSSLIDTGSPGDRTHFVWSIGTNLDGSNRPIDPTKSYCRYAMEYNYWNPSGIGFGPEYTHEFHLPAAHIVTAPGVFSELRPLTIAVGDTSRKAVVLVNASAFSIGDESSTHAKGGYNFDGDTAFWNLLYNNGSGPDGTIYSFAGGKTSDVFAFGRGPVPATKIHNGSQIAEQLQLGGVVKYTRGVDSANGGQYTLIGPTGTTLETSWTAAGVSNKYYNERLKVGGFLTLAAQVQIQPDSASTIGHAVRAATSQTADLNQSIDSAGAVRVRVNKDANLIIRRNTAPADVDLNASEFSLWLDDTPGATVLKVKAKDSGGTVRTGSIPLSWSGAVAERLAA